VVTSSRGKPGDIDGSLSPYSRIQTDVYSPRIARYTSTSNGVAPPPISLTEEPNRPSSPNRGEYAYRVLASDKYVNTVPKGSVNYLPEEIASRTPFANHPYSSVYSIERASPDRFDPSSVRTAGLNLAAEAVSTTPGYSGRSGMEGSRRLIYPDNYRGPIFQRVSEETPYKSGALTHTFPEAPYRYVSEATPYKSCTSTHTFTEAPYRYERMDVTEAAPNETRVIATGQYIERPYRYDRYFPSYFPYYNSKVVRSVSTSTTTDFSGAQSPESQ
jgi:hypothetical protein